MRVHVIGRMIKFHLLSERAILPALDDTVLADGEERECEGRNTVDV